MKMIRRQRAETQVGTYGDRQPRLQPGPFSYKIRNIELAMLGKTGFNALISALSDISTTPQRYTVQATHSAVPR